MSRGTVARYWRGPLARLPQVAPSGYPLLVVDTLPLQLWVGTDDGVEQLTSLPGNSARQIRALSFDSNGQPVLDSDGQPVTQLSGEPEALFVGRNNEMFLYAGGEILPLQLNADNLVGMAGGGGSGLTDEQQAKLEHIAVANDIDLDALAQAVGNAAESAAQANRQSEDASEAAESARRAADAAGESAEAAQSRADEAYELAGPHPLDIHVRRPRSTIYLYAEPFFNNKDTAAYSNNSLDPSWWFRQMVEAIRQNRHVLWTVVLNPNDGAGDALNANYTRAIQWLHGAGARVIGYIPSTFGGTHNPDNSSTLINQQDSDDDYLEFASRWYSFYPEIDGIFVDEVPYQSTGTDAGDAAFAFYQRLVAHIRDLGADYIEGNPGQYQSNLRYFELFDALNICETNPNPTVAKIAGDYRYIGTGFQAQPSQKVASLYGLGKTAVLQDIADKAESYAQYVDSLWLWRDSAWGSNMTASEWNTDVWARFINGVGQGLLQWINRQIRITAAERAKLGLLSITSAADIDRINARVNYLDSAMVLAGTWDASSGAFPQAASVGDTRGGIQAGYTYAITAAGTVDGVDFSTNDRLLALVDGASANTYAGNWLKQDYTDQVTTVAGRTGAIVLGFADINGLGDAAKRNAADFATAAQGKLADTATQEAPNDGFSYERKSGTWDVSPIQKTGETTLRTGPKHKMIGGSSIIMPTSPGATLPATNVNQSGLIFGSGAYFLFTDTIDVSQTPAANVINNFNNATGVLIRRNSTGGGSFFDCQSSDGNSSFSVAKGGNVSAIGTVTPGRFTVSTLPSSPGEGAQAFATNGRKSNQMLGAGTGVPVYYSQGSWRVAATDAAVQA